MQLPHLQFPYRKKKVFYEKNFKTFFFCLWRHKGGISWVSTDECFYLLKQIFFLLVCLLILKRRTFKKVKEFSKIHQKMPSDLTESVCGRSEMQKKKDIMKLKNQKMLQNLIFSDIFSYVQP